MNDAILAEQLRKTGNLMDLLNDKAWIREADADHASEEGTVEAGLGLQPYAAQCGSLRQYLNLVPLHSTGTLVVWREAP